MQQTNYIRHLNAVFIQFSKDNRLNPTHISLYVALFQLWNTNRFPEEFYINRDEVMHYSKIGSRTTYHRCIKELSHWKYVIYYPSHNPFKGSKIKMFKFGTSTGQVLYPSHTNIETSSGQALVSNINNNKQIENNYKLEKPKSENEVIIFFKNENWPEIEAQKFFNHYQSNGWKIGGRSKMVDWHAASKNWILKSLDLKSQKTLNGVDHNTDNLKTTNNKNYNEPL